MPGRMCEKHKVDDCEVGSCGVMRFMSGAKL